MSLLDDVRQKFWAVYDPDLGQFKTDDRATYRDFLGTFTVAAPEIITVLERAQALCDALGPLTVDVAGNVHVNEDLVWRLQRAMEA